MARGSLRIYLGAAPGVGKTFAMLGEGRRVVAEGVDAVIGVVETHGRDETAAQLVGLETVPRRVVRYRDQDFEEMDLDAVLERRPSLALVDELAHTNVPGLRHTKRWEDIDVLLDEGIDVLSTLNIQHLASLNDVVEAITGVRQRETVPDEWVRRADELELVDLPPEVLRRRLADGRVYPAERIDAALANYFRPGNLGALRELALMWVAERVDDDLQDYLDAHGIGPGWETRERVVVAVTGAPSGEHLVRRAARMAGRGRGELIGVHIRSDSGLRTPSSAQLERNRQILDELGGSYVEVVGPDVAEVLLRTARNERATQLVLGATRRSRWAELTQGSVIRDVIRGSGPIDIHVISATDPEPDVERPARPRAGAKGDVVFSRRRRAWAWALALIGTPLLTAVLVAMRPEEGLAGSLPLYLLLLVGVALIGGVVPAMAVAVAGFLGANWLLTPPFQTLTIKEGTDLLALVSFLVVAAVVSFLVGEVARRSAEVARAHAAADTLARAAADLAVGPDPVPLLLERIRTTFELVGVALASNGSADATVLAGAGEGVPDLDLSVVGGAHLKIWGGRLTARDREVLDALAAQLGAALEQRALREAADRTTSVEETDRLRTAILRAVSHDLRTPLASIKASVSSLLADDVDWSDDTRREFLATIDEECDRLDRLVGNLLDMSRLEAGAVSPHPVEVGLDDVVAAGLHSLSGAPSVLVSLADDLPSVRTDPVLLERAIANVVANAVRYCPTGVAITAGVVGDDVHLRVVDRGPGLSLDRRAALFEPFQREGDTSAADGVGLGLAVARGFTEAVGGRIHLDDTPGGGLTVTFELPQAGP